MEGGERQILVRCTRGIQYALLDQFHIHFLNMLKTPHIFLSILIIIVQSSLFLAWIWEEPITDISAFSSAFLKIHSPSENISKTYLFIRDSWALWNITDFGVRLVWIWNFLLLSLWFKQIIEHHCSSPFLCENIY